MRNAFKTFLNLLVTVLSIAVVLSGKAETSIVGWGWPASAGSSNVVAVDAGGYHGLALKSDGTVMSWGYNDYGQSKVPNGLDGVIAIAAGEFHSVALKADGTVVEWGALNAVPSWLSNVVAIAAGDQHSMALRADGTVVTWGDDFVPERLNLPAGLKDVAAIGAGPYVDLAVKSDGTVVIWGDDITVPLTVPSDLTNAVQVSAGAWYRLALRADGSLTEWPYGVGFGIQSNVISIASGREHSLILKSDGAVIGRGRNYEGQINTPAGLTNVAVIAAGAFSSLALCSTVPLFSAVPIHRTAATGRSVILQVPVAGAVPLHYQWQFAGVDLPNATNASLRLTDLNLGQSGNYTLVASNRYGVVASNPIELTVEEQAPFLVRQSSNVWVTVGSTNTLMAEIGGSLPMSYQWYFNGTTLSSATNSSLILSNVWISNEGDYCMVAQNAFGGVTSAVKKITVERLIAWGNNYVGQTNIPMGLTNVVAVSGGEVDTLALLANGQVVGWGGNSNGLFNAPSHWSNVVAVANGGWFKFALRAGGTVVDWSGTVAGLSNVVAISAGRGHVVALKNDGTVAVWGSDDFGQCDVPSGLRNVRAIAAGMYHSLALRQDGTVAAWGLGWEGATNVPTNLSNVVSIAAGYLYNLALKSDGTVVAWGENWGGKANVPTTLRDVVAIAAGSDHSVALRSDGTVVGWGANTDGQSTVPAGLSNIVAISAGGWHTVARYDIQTNWPPFTVGETLGILAGQTLSLNASYLLANDRDPDGDAISVISVDATSVNGGAVSFDGNVMTYAPPTNFFGIDRFSYVVGDGRGGVTVAWITAMVHPASSSGLILASPSASGGRFTLQLNGFEEFTYRLLRATNVAGPWETISHVTVGTNGAAQFEEPSPLSSRAFYRIVFP